ncbi:MAG: ABC transporter permease [Pseudonocardiales bacterium]|nr:MAG: ABC transporter permease [Pseudonocardiales bacterium]
MTAPPPPGSAAPSAAVPTERDHGSFSLDIERPGPRDAVRAYVTRIRSGDPGALPSVLGLIVLVIIFNQISGRFLGKANIGNLPGQGAYIAIIALGLVFVLLLGEIDLAAGTTGGLAAAYAAQAVFAGGLHKGVPGLFYGITLALLIGAALLGFYMRLISGPILVVVGAVLLLSGADKHVIPALIISVSIGAAIGIFTGWLVAKVGIPSFIVTLALFLAWQGVVLYILNSQPINVVQYGFWNGLANDNMSPTWGWVYLVVLLLGYLGYTLSRALRARRRELAGDAISLVLIRFAAIAAVGIVVVAFLNQNRNPNPTAPIRGVPWAAAVPIGLMILCTLALTKTTWGRHLFAIGGNAEAARRAGIDVTRIRITAFTVSSAIAAIGGAFLASQQGSVNLSIGAGNILLFAVAAAVIGGTSLFGGRGKPRDAIIGALVISIIPNGLGLKPSLAIHPEYQQIITGLVLLLAAAVDALSRRRARQS